MIEATYTHIGLCVSNIERSRAFYEGLLGFRFVRELRNKGSDVQDRFLQLKDVNLHAVFLQKNGLELELLSFAHPSVKLGPRRAMNDAGLTHISLRVADVPKALEGVKAAGGEVIDSTRVRDTACFIRDPDGQLIELVAASAPAGH